MLEIHCRMCRTCGQTGLETSFEKKDGQMFRQTKALYVACGSLNKITEKQVEYAEKTGVI